MEIKIVDQRGKPIIGAKATGYILASCIGFEDQLIRVDQVTGVESEPSVAIELVKDLGLQRLHMANIVSELFGFSNYSEVPNNFKGIVVTTGNESLKKARWIEKVEVMPNTAIVSIPVLYEMLGANEGIASESMFRKVVRRGKMIARHAFASDKQFVIVNGLNAFHQERILWNRGEEWQTVIHDFGFDSETPHNPV